MATFSVNQVRHLFVANARKASAVVDSDATGTIAVHTNASGDIYFTYKGVDGLTRTDLIPRGQLKLASATSSDNLRRALRIKRVALEPTINGGAPVVGQDYIVGLNFRNYIGLSDEETIYKNASVYVTAGMTATQFYTALAEAINNAFSPSEDVLVIATGSADGVDIEEQSQRWSLGVIENSPVNFDVQPRRILVNGDSLIWGVVTDQPPTNYVEDGQVIADLEYFCMGERGDVYRGVGFPRVIHTTYLVDPSQTYDVIDLHFYYQGDNHAVQFSEKTLTIVGADTAVINAIIGDINTILTAQNSPITIATL